MTRAIIVNEFSSTETAGRPRISCCPPLIPLYVVVMTALVAGCSESDKGLILRQGPGMPGQIHLSWADEPSSSFTVTWHTPGRGTTAFVNFREKGAEPWRKQLAKSVKSPGSGYLHSVTVTGLASDSTYEYRVGNGEGADRTVSENMQTRTAPGGDSARFTFAFLCDTGIAGRRDGNANGTRRVIDGLVGDDPLFILGGGDYAYANFDNRFATTGEAVDAWFRQMEPIFRRAPFMPQFGNHEILLDESYGDWAPRFNLPSGVKANRGRFYDLRQALEGIVSYSFDVGSVHFTALFVPDPDVDPETVAWLDRDLGEARSRGAEWLVVYQHEPLFAHGYVHPAFPRVRQKIAPVLEKHRVDLHLSGHDQSYERTLPLRNAAGALEPVSMSRDEYAAGSGVLYLKISPGGKMSERRNEFSRFLAPAPAFVAARSDTVHHYALFSVDGSEELGGTIIGISGDSGQRRVVDSFRIRKRILDDGN